MTHAELIAALEAATEPSQELDAEIAKGLGWVSETRLNRPSWWARPDEVRLPLPEFTSSLDAALTLVPSEWRITLTWGQSARELSSRTGIPQHRIGRWVTGVNARGNPCQAPDNVLRYLRAVASVVESVKLPEGGK